MSSAPTSEGDILLDDSTVETIQGDGALFRLLAVQLDENVDTGDALFRTIIGTFTLTDHSGAYTVDILWSRDWDTELGATMTLYANQLETVYGYKVPGD